MLGGALEMYPAAITQKEKQLARLAVGIENQFVDFSEPIIREIAFRFNGNLYCYLAYPVTTQTTTVSLASSNIESHTKVMPVFHLVLPR